MARFTFHTHDQRDVEWLTTELLISDISNRLNRLNPDTPRSGIGVELEAETDLETMRKVMGRIPRPSYMNATVAIC